MVVVRRNKKWVLLSRDRSKVLGTHSSRQGALNQEKAIQASKARVASKKNQKK
jgi:hypothetical protein